jgi:hypothetical protein
MSTKFLPAAVLCLATAASASWAMADDANNGTVSSPPAITSGSTTGDQTPAPAATPAATPAGQTPPAPATPPAAPPAKSVFTQGGVDFAGYVDVYYSWNDNHPTGGFNQLYTFDDKTDQFDLNMAKLSISRDPAPIGFRFDIGLGRVFDNLHPYGHPDPGFFRFVEQAYVSVKPKDTKGFEADLGMFVTSAGAEVIEAKDNWNYSRSLLFAFAIPYYHFGIRTSMPIGSSLTVGVQVVNGWNNIIDDSGKNMQTVGITAAVARKKYTWSSDYYVGPNVTGVNHGDRNLFDTTLLLTPNDKLNAYVNLDFAGQSHIGGGTDRYEGVAAALRYQLPKNFAFSPRVEYFKDGHGYATGTVQTLHEVTLTGEYKIHEGLLARAEYRHDGSNVPFYDRGNQIGVTKTQNTVTIGLMAFFAPKH